MNTMNTDNKFIDLDGLTHYHNNLLNFLYNLSIAKSEIDTIFSGDKIPEEDQDDQIIQPEKPYIIGIWKYTSDYYTDYYRYRPNNTYEIYRISVVNDETGETDIRHVDYGSYDIKYDKDLYADKYYISGKYTINGGTFSAPITVQGDTLTMHSTVLVKTDSIPGVELDYNVNDIEDFDNIENVFSVLSDDYLGYGFIAGNMVDKPINSEYFEMDENVNKNIIIKFNKDYTYTAGCFINTSELQSLVPKLGTYNLTVKNDKIILCGSCDEKPWEHEFYVTIGNATWPAAVPTIFKGNRYSIILKAIDNENINIEFLSTNKFVFTGTNFI